MAGNSLSQFMQYESYYLPQLVVYTSLLKTLLTVLL